MRGPVMPIPQSFPVEIVRPRVRLVHADGRDLHGRSRRHNLHRRVGAGALLALRRLHFVRRSVNDPGAASTTSRLAHDVRCLAHGVRRLR